MILIAILAAWISIATMLAGLCLAARRGDVAPAFVLEEESEGATTVYGVPEPFTGHAISAQGLHAPGAEMAGTASGSARAA